MRTTHRIIIGDSREMEEIRDESVHLIITSPPYWQLKDYGHEGQIGFNDTYEDYVNNLNLVWQECFRVLYPGCRLCINIGDQFARAAYYGRYKVIPIRTEVTKFCETIGFDYMGAIIWQKVTTTNTTGGATIMGSFPFPRNGIIKIDYEFILIFKKLGTAPRPSGECKELSKLTTSEWNEYFTGHWNFAGERQDKHLAMFPEELPKRLTRMFTFVGDTVLDPFLGSGTTSLAAKNLARNSAGYEINPEFLSVMRQKLGIIPSGVSSDQADYEFKVKTLKPDDLSSRVEKLPYVFKDRVPFDKEMDPRTSGFGSQIDGSQKPPREYFTVRRILSPEIIELDSGVQVRLLGVKAIEQQSAKALAYLSGLIMNRRVYLRFDPAAQTGDGEPPQAYVYARNRTFINAHLIKRHYAGVAENMEFHFKQKFVTYAKA